jgi:hypothetical protein
VAGYSLRALVQLTSSRRIVVACAVGDANGVVLREASGHGRSAWPNVCFALDRGRMRTLRQVPEVPLPVTLLRTPHKTERV